MKYFQHRNPASKEKGEAIGNPKARRLRQRQQYGRQPESRSRRQVQGAAFEEKESLQHSVTSEKIPDEQSWNGNTSTLPHPSHAVQRESTKDTVSILPHTSRNLSEEEMLGRLDNSSVKRRNQPDMKLESEAAPTPGLRHPTNGLVMTLKPQVEGAGSVTGVCTCPGISAQAQSPHSHQLVLAEKGVTAKGRQVHLQRPHDTHIPTPRTEEAAWAAAAITFLFVLLTLAVLYTRLYRNFHRSRSLYWDLGNGCEGQETVSSVIKRRLLSRQSRWKRWQKPRKPHLILPESSSDSSD